VSDTDRGASVALQAASCVETPSGKYGVTVRSGHWAVSDADFVKGRRVPES
jgi:hypothetical protein